MTSKHSSTGYIQNPSKLNPRASSRSRIPRTKMTKMRKKTLLQSNQRMRMMKTRTMKRSSKLPGNTGKVEEEATEADTEIDEEDTTVDLTIEDLMAENTTTVDIMSIQSMDIMDTEVDTATEDTTVTTATQEAAD